MSRFFTHILRLELAALGFIAGGSIGETFMWDKSPANDTAQVAKVEHYDAKIQELKQSRERLERLDLAMAAPELLSVLNPDNKDMKKQFETATAYLAKERENYQQGVYNISYSLATDSGLDEEKAATIYKSLTAIADKKLQKDLEDKAPSFRGLQECQVQFAAQADYGANQKSAQAVSDCASDKVSDVSYKSGFEGSIFMLAACFAIPALRRRRLEVAEKKPAKSQDKQDKSVDMQVVIKRKGM